MDKIDELLTRGVEKIYPSREELEKVLRSGKKLKLYQGFDPSMPNLHLGNFVGLMKLKQWQDLGHEVIFLVGDFTGMIGDPTDKSSARIKLTRDQVLENAKSWKEQAGKILNFEGENPAKIMFNSTWNDKITYKDLIEITSNFTVQQLLERDMFQKRLQENKPIFLHELLYPVAQAIDCVKMDVDLELGGKDQLFNMMAGRTLMAAMSNKEKFVMTTKLLIDSSGAKVGKTTGNAVFVNSLPKDIYGSIMSFPDEVISLGFELLTTSETPETDPMNAKKILAFEVTKILSDENSAKLAKGFFESTVQNKEMPTEIPEFKISVDTNIVDILVQSGLAPSNSEAKRLIAQNAVEINGIKINDLQKVCKKNDIIKSGKRKYIKVI